MNICVISDGYPYKDRNDFVFVQQLCNELARQGHTVIVIAPQSLTKRLIRSIPKAPYRRIEVVEGGKVTVYCPQYISLGNFGKYLRAISKLREKSVNKIISSLHKDIDVIYGHFWHSGYVAYHAAKKYNIPIVVASGESVISMSVSTKDIDEFTDYISGLICVSNKNLKVSIEKGLLRLGTPYKVIPNAINERLFHLMDKSECRSFFNIKSDDFVISFVGGFITRKGPERVSEAITLLNDNQIKSFFIGSKQDGIGNNPKCNGILYSGPVKHDMLPVYLNASDVFVLPTLSEGCCNAIIEAMACGLPIISSDRDFNYDILDETNSIMVDPMDIQEIAQAINELKKNEYQRKFLSEGAIKKSSELTISQRASKIISFLSHFVTDY